MEDYCRTDDYFIGMDVICIRCKKRLQIALGNAWNEKAWTPLHSYICEDCEPSEENGND